MTSIPLRSRFMGFGALLLVCGCASYRPQPLNDHAVDQALTPPAPEAVRVAAANIHHPLLAPLALDLNVALEPDQVAVLAVLLNPTLRALRDQRALASAQVLQAGILPNPQLSLSTDQPTGGATSGTVNAYGIGLAWEVTALITRGARIDAATAGAKAIDVGVAWQEWQVAMGAKLAAYRLVALLAQRDEAESIARAHVAFLAAAETAAERGHRLITDLAVMRSAGHDAQAVALTAAQDVDRQRLQLNRALGIAPEANVRLNPAAFADRDMATPARALADGWQADLRNRRLDLIALKHGYDSQEAVLHAAVLAQFPRISLGFQHARDTGDVVTSGFGLVIDLPFFDRNQGAIASEQATRQKLYDEYLGRLFEARSDLALAASDCDALVRQIASAATHAAAAERTARELAAAAERGQADQPSADLATVAAAQARLDLLKLHQAHVEARIALELAAGAYVPSVAVVEAGGTHAAANGSGHKETP